MSVMTFNQRTALALLASGRSITRSYDLMGGQHYRWSHVSIDHHANVHPSTFWSLLRRGLIAQWKLVKTGPGSSAREYRITQAGRELVT
jgi:hypothetical protein